MNYGVKNAEIMCSRLKELQEVNGYTDKDVCKFTGMSPITLRKYRIGELKNIPVSTIERLADLYSVSVDYILGRTDMSKDEYKRDVAELQMLAYEKYLKEKKKTHGGTALSTIVGTTDIVLPWPYNVIDQISNGEIEFPLTREQIDIFYDILKNKLTEREQTCLISYCKDGYTLGEIAKTQKVTKERIRQIIKKALRRLSNPINVNYIMKGYDIKSYNNQLGQAKIEVMLLEKEIEDYKARAEKLKETRDILAAEIGQIQMPKEDEYKEIQPVSLMDMNLSSHACNSIVRTYVRRGALRNSLTSDDVFALFISNAIYNVRGVGTGTAKEIAKRLLELGYDKEIITKALLAS